MFMAKPVINQPVKKLQRPAAIIIIALCIGAFYTLPCKAESNSAADNPAIDFTAYNLEELMNYEVTSAAKQPERFFETDAALFVITQEDIRRSGATAVPELFRMVPGMQVGRIDSDKWAISCRGFNGQFANKLLVLIDGRTVYTPLYSGVFWDMQDLILDDIARIEIIRGPGATLWGSNAVNGVVNIITKKTQDTQGGLVSTAWGTVSDGYTGVRYGGRLNEKFSYRVYAKYSKLSNVEDSLITGDPKYYTGGFRIDGTISALDTLTVLGGSTDSYSKYDGMTADAASNNSAPPQHLTVSGQDLRSHLESRYLLARWAHAFSSASDTALQMYYDRSQYKYTDHTGSTFLEKQRFDTFDIDFQHRFAVIERNTILWGLNYRYTHSNFNNSFNTSFDPKKNSHNQFSFFIQDKIDLVKNRLSLTVGSKYEHSYFTGSEYQPSARLCFTPGLQHTVWASVSRAVRTPGYNERDIRLQMPLASPGSSSPLVAELAGSRSFKSENLLASELGYRFQPMHNLIFDIALFYNAYDSLRTLEDKGLVKERGYVGYVMKTDNMMDGTTCGFEVSATWQMLDWWQLQPAYTHLKMSLDPDSGSSDTQHELDEGISPKNRVSVRSLMDIDPAVEFDTTFYYTDALSGYRIARIFDMDARIGWKPRKNLDLSLIGQNIFHRRHNEFTNEIARGNFLPSGQIRRSVYARITWEF